MQLYNFIEMNNKTQTKLEEAEQKLAQAEKQYNDHISIHGFPTLPSFEFSVLEKELARCTSLVVSLNHLVVPYTPGT